MNCLSLTVYDSHFSASPTYPMMDAKEFGEALFNEYFINETHAIRIIESCYGGPTNWSSIQWTKDESATKHTRKDTSPCVFTIPSGVSSTGDSAPGDEVPGMTIFWILLFLCFACVYHPLASSIHNHSRFRQYFHVSPLFCCLDVIFMAIQCWVIGEQYPISWRRVVEVVVNHRLKAFLSLAYPHGQPVNLKRRSPRGATEGNASGSTSRTEPEHREPTSGGYSTTNTPADPPTNTTAAQPHPTPWLLVSRAPNGLVTQAALNIYVRLVADALNIVLYTKISGFCGIRPWFVVADCFFNCWLVMELFLFLGYYAAPRRQPDASAESAYLSTLAVKSSALTPPTEASALTPLFVEMHVSSFAIYYTIGSGSTIGSFYWHVVEWYLNQPCNYLVELPIVFFWSLPHPLFLPGLFCASTSAVVWMLGLILLSVLAILVFFTLPVCYYLVLAIFCGAGMGLAQRYHRPLRISDSTQNIICARVLVAVICTHYVVYFAWLYDS